MSDDRSRRAGFRVTREHMIEWLLHNTNFSDRYPGADHLAVHYDFDMDSFTFLFTHPSLGKVSDGETLPMIHAPTEYRRCTHLRF